MKQLSKEQAMALGGAKFWESMSFRERAEFQMFQELMCMPFDVFHEAIEKTLGRPVFTHEFGMNLEGLTQELMGHRPPPTIQEIINMIPADKRVLIVRESD